MQAATLRDKLVKMGKFKEALGDAFSCLDRDDGGAGAANRADYGSRARIDSMGHDSMGHRSHDGAVSRQEFAAAWSTSGVGMRGGGR